MPFAWDAREALDMIDRHQPDAAMLDVRLPPPDGLEVCERLRAAKNPIPILILTARGGVAFARAPARGWCEPHA